MGAMIRAIKDQNAIYFVVTSRMTVLQTVSDSVAPAENHLSCLYKYK